jgi:serine protease AprX
VVDAKLQVAKIVATHYQHVDGTSFAAPIVASIVAQMIEANPDLTPATIKNILVSTADRLSKAPIMRQGYGAINARRAVAMSLVEQHEFALSSFAPPRIENGCLVFLFHDDAAKSVSLASDLNGWDHLATAFTNESGGLWRAVISPAPLPGRYRYKLVIDGVRWIDDPNNGYKEPDEFGGMNSIVNIQDCSAQAVE